MDGKKVSVDGPFIGEGDAMTAKDKDGNELTMTAKFDVGNPPLHPSCRCCLLPVVDGAGSSLDQEAGVAHDPSTSGHGGDEWPDEKDANTVSDESLEKWDSAIAAIEDAEAQYIGMENEWGRVIGIDGQMLMKDREGGKSEVYFTGKEIEQMAQHGAAVMFHNHPSGNSFSLADLKLASNGNLSMMIASGINNAGDKFRYEIIRPAHGWPPSEQWRKSYKKEEDKLKLKFLEDWYYKRIPKDRMETEFDHELIKRLEQKFKFTYNRISLR
ncbi:MAG: hypothetical protein NTX50_05940 [Candidatus Sumerlaeota bacterium]|nr:hypothetical protein [Candidatus Sumerlaeota bacterium]